MRRSLMALRLSGLQTITSRAFAAAGFYAKNADSGPQKFTIGFSYFEYEETLKPDSSFKG